MKLPNGYGSVYKLSGKRRKPWTARITTGWTFDEDRQKSYPVYRFIGYYSNRSEALDALADYHRDPYNLDNKNITFAEIFRLWSSEHFPEVSQGNIIGYNACYKHSSPLHDMKMSEIKLGHLQKCLDESGKNSPTLKKMKILYSLMWEYCVRNEILTPDKRQMIQYLNTRKAGNPNRLDRSPFSRDEISRLWKVSDNEKIQICLFLIYTGLRVSEMYNLKKEDVHLQERFFDVTRSKTEAGVRQVPIAEKIVFILEYWLQKEGDFVFTSNGKQLYDRNFRDIWKNTMNDVMMSHLPHDTRHTCISLLTEAGVDERIIKKIVGHKGEGITQAIYTHLDLPIKLEAINRI